MAPRSAALLVLIAAVLAGCSGRGGDDELMRRVAQADAAASRAEAAAARAEAAARKAESASSGPSSEPTETIYEPGPDMDESYGHGTDPEPSQG